MQSVECEIMLVRDGEPRNLGTSPFIIGFEPMKGDGLIIGGKMFIVVRRVFDGNDIKIVVVNS